MKSKLSAMKTVTHESLRSADIWNGRKTQITASSISQRTMFFVLWCLKTPRTIPPSPPPPRTFARVACKWKVSDCLLVGELVALGELDIASLGLEDKYVLVEQLLDV